MFQSFRLAMTWLHTWFGLVLGFVLMVVFFFGSLSVFDREIDRWAIPETRFEPQTMPSFERVLAPVFAQLTPDEAELSAARARVGKLDAPLPVKSFAAYTTHRDPVLAMYAEFAVPNPRDPEDHVHGHATIDPRSGERLRDEQLKLGSGFFYPLHFSLHWEWLGMGYWLVGVSALVMLAALVSGVVIHKRLLRELFTFRPGSNPQRSTLDLHNLTGVLALPFHFLFPLTGLIVFAGIYFPLSQTTFKALHDRHEVAEAASKGLAAKPAGVPAPLAPVDAMVAEAKRRWAARGMPGEVGYLYVDHVGDVNSYVSIYRAGSDRVSLVGQAVHFSGTTGAVLHEEAPATVVSGVHDFLVGLHLQHFRHWLLRWLYVLGGLSGCVCIATGLVFFVNKRKVKHTAQGLSGARWVDALSTTAVTGMLLATAAIFVANRALPPDLSHRDDWQRRVFWAVWLCSFAHAAWRSSPVTRGLVSPAWREQCWALSLLAPAAVLLNWATTGAHWGRTIPEGYWPVAGVDLALTLVAVLSALAARRLGSLEPRAGSTRAALSEAVHG